MKRCNAIFLLLFGAGFLSATPVLSNKVTADLVNPGTNPLAESNGDYVGPYTLSVNGKNYSAMCIDVEDTAHVGVSYSAYETSLSGGNFADTYNPNAGTEYKEEAYLMSLIVQPNADRIDIQDAAWAITDPNYKPNRAAVQYVDMALANYTKVNLSNFEIISGVDANCGRAQEFMIDPGAASATPEPSTTLLMGGGLLLAGLVRRKMTKKAPTS